MTGTLEELLLASTVLLVTHFGLSSTPLRAFLVMPLGERPFLVFYSLVSITCLVWLVLSYRAAPVEPIWAAPEALSLLPQLFAGLGIIFLVGGVSTKNPTAVGQQGGLNAETPARGILRITRHPVMWAIGLWALAHIPNNGDVASVLFFGTFAVLALAGTLTIDRKNAQRHGVTWQVFAAATSNLPFLAIAQRRQSLTAAAHEYGLARLAIATLIYLVLLYGHELVFGVSAWLTP